MSDHVIEGTIDSLDDEAARSLCKSVEKAKSCLARVLEHRQCNGFAAFTP